MIFSVKSSYSQIEKKYFQQEVHYTIHVSLDDEKNFLHAQEKIIYINHSPDTLHFIWFHLWPNAYKNNQTAFAKQFLKNGHTNFQDAKEKDRGFIDSLNFTVNGKAAALIYDNQNIDIAKLILNEALPPNDSIEIATPFRVKIPLTFSRMGHDGQRYAISQWYPKPAVYDRLGWHPFPYLDQGEFYSEFGSFNVFITLPENYVVGATGLLQNEEEKKWMEQKVISTKQFLADTVPSLSVNSKKIVNRFPPSAHETKTLHFIADSVHDFAWFADKRYRVLNDSVLLPHSNKKIKTWVLFNDDDLPVWKNSIYYVDSAVYYYSRWVGDYPYASATAVEGALSAGGGMEYPMITVISDVRIFSQLEETIAHEVGHNWFYGALGFNERDYAWMDEGINTFYENRYAETRFHDRGLIPYNSSIGKLFSLTQYPHNYQNYLLYLFQAAQHLDQPMDLNADRYTELNYAAVIYSKTAEVFRYLEDFLGEQEFDAAMQNFYDQWKFKHPYPQDLRTSLQEFTHENFDWLFDELISTDEKIDFKLTKAVKNYGGGNKYYRLNIKKKEEFQGPISVGAYKGDQLEQKLWFPSVQEEGGSVLFPQGDYDYFRIDPDFAIPEINRQNNFVRTRGIFPTMEKIKFQFLFSIDDPKRTQIFFTPALGYNNYNKGMLGIALYNSVLPTKKLNVVAVPMFGFGNSSVVGLGKISLQTYPDDFLHGVRYEVSAQTFHDEGPASDAPNLRYWRLSGRAIADLHKKDLRSPVSQQLIYRNVFITQQEAVETAKQYVSSDFNLLTYSLKNSRAINPFSLIANAEQGADQEKNFYVKTYASGTFRLSYPKKKSGVDIRAFGGLFLYKHDLINENYAFHLNGTQGFEDYLFDELYLGRNGDQRFFNQQFALKDGAFKPGATSEYFLTPSSTWLFTANVTVPLPFFSPLFAFGDAGLLPSETNNFQYEAGIGITLIPNVCQLYFPFLFSTDIKNQFNNNGQTKNWYNRISFTLNINLLNPFDLIRNANPL